MTIQRSTVQLLRSALGVSLILVGLVALMTPFTPGSWLALVGTGLLGVRTPLGDRLRRWTRRRIVKATHP